MTSGDFPLKPDPGLPLKSAVAAARFPHPMARRASSSVPPIWIAGILLLLLASGAGGYFVYRAVGDPFRAVPELNVEIYLENANSLRGNVYKFRGTVANALNWSPTAGRLFSVESGGNVIPILVPSEFNHINIQQGQQFFFRIEVVEKGVLRAQEVRKV